MRRGICGTIGGRRIIRDEETNDVNDGSNDGR